MKRIFSVGIFTAALLMSCTQTPTMPNNSPALMGELEVRFEHGNARATFTPVQSLRPQAELLNEAQLNFNLGSRTTQTIAAVSNDERFLTAKFPISNGTGAVINRLTLVAYVKTGNVGETAMKNITNFGGTVLTQTNKALSVKPTHAMKATGCPNTTPCVDDLHAGLQVFSEAEVANLTTLAGTALTGTERLLAYGYVARNGGTRNIQANNNSTDGHITIAVRVPSSGAGTTGDAYSFSMTFLVFKQPTDNNAFVQSLEEQIDGTVGGEALANLPSTAKLRILPGGTQNFPSVRGMKNVRTAGTANNPLAVLGTWIQSKPNGLFGLGTTINVRFPSLMNAPTGSNAKLYRFMGVGSNVNGIPTNPLSFFAPTSPARPFFPNEQFTYFFKNLTAFNSSFESFPSTTGRAYVGQLRAGVGGTGEGNFAASAVSAVTSNSTDTYQITLLDSNNSGTLTTFVEDNSSFGDLDNDNDLDKISKSGGNLIISYNDGSGAFTPSSPIVVSSTDDIWSIELGDIDGDGLLDMVVPTSSTTTDSIAVLTAQSGYTPVKYTNINYPSAQLSDLDNDGDLDIVAMDFSSPAKLYVLKNNGTGVFTVPAAITTTSPSNNRLLTGDLNNDGIPDLIALNNSEQPVDLYLGDGTGEFNFGSSLNPMTSPTGTTGAVALGDVDNDADLDIAFTLDSDVETEDGVYIYKNNGTGSFSSSGVFAMPNPDGICFVDADGDNDLDIYAVALTKDTNNTVTAVNKHLLVNNP
jgi:FG-GAP-like repeat